MPRVTVETVAHVARLARLSLGDDQRATFARQLDEILAYAESIQGLDLTGVPPMSHAHVANALRADEPGASLPREAVFEQAPDARDGLFRVPRVIG